MQLANTKSSAGMCTVLAAVSNAHSQDVSSAPPFCSVVDVFREH